MEKEIQAYIVDVHGRVIFPGTLKFSGKKITSIKYDESAKGCNQYIMPGFVDAHIHIESSMLVPSEFAKIAVRHGTVATVSDPHEIANVLGVEGVQYMIDDGKKTPLKFNFGAPSCVPATNFESAGATINSRAIESLLKSKDIKYLAEMMNWPGVLYGDAEVKKKILAAKTLNKPIDGHAPGLKGEQARKYASAGISTDHECVELEEARDKLEAGMKIQIREGSAAKNYEALAPLIKTNPESLMFCTDDSHPHELIDYHMDKFVHRSIENGDDIFNVIKIASINPINHYKLDVGQLRVGDYADFIIVDSITDFNIIATYIDGEKVAENGKELFTTPKAEIVNKFNCTKKHTSFFDVDYQPEDKIRCIVAHDGQLITSTEVHEYKSFKRNDVLKMTVVNRYEDTDPSIAFIKGFGLFKGAIASTVAHDSHNIVAVGTSDYEIYKAVNKVIDMKGGICIVSHDETNSLELPIAGLMTNENGEIVAEQYQKLLDKAKEYGSQLHDPYMTLSFMALLVIPQLKLSDKGLFDGSTFKFTDLLVK
ncbi:adenine deaminase [Flammeovirga sp. EKP202]|uniref:adenine deaminase n=1 Tax=Flammeovirga sp. EKP202 TaxID=2770592 RepID=UPI00165F2061|nr:adenine deaminase [Flammeovirga sp. EKP202]MBD0402153.1 adenine deaminase [Flammeovirga sp. EKP202]